MSRSNAEEHVSVRMRPPARVIIRLSLPGASSIDARRDARTKRRAGKFQHGVRRLEMFLGLSKYLSEIEISVSVGPTELPRSRSVLSHPSASVSAPTEREHETRDLTSTRSQPA